MATVTRGNLLDVTEGIIVHQCNCRGVMGRGLAKSVRDKWPLVYAKYRVAYQTGLLNLGTVQFVRVQRTPRLHVCNLMGQGKWGTGEARTDLFAHLVAWPKINKQAQVLGLSVYVPWKIGCGLGGEDFKELRPIIEELCPNITWVRL